MKLWNPGSVFALTTDMSSALRPSSWTLRPHSLAGTHAFKRWTFQQQLSLTWPSAHMGKWDQLTLWKNGWKIKKRKHARWGWSDTSDDWLVQLMIIIIVIIIDHYPSSRVSLFLYILRRSPNSLSYWRERCYADNIFIQTYFRMQHFVVKFSKFCSTQATRVHWPPNQNPADLINQQIKRYLNARQSSKLARPNTPLATGVKKISSVNKTNKIGCHNNVPWRIEILISDYSSTAVVLPTLRIWRRSVRYKLILR